MSVKLTDEENEAILRAVDKRNVSKSDLVREGLVAIGVLTDPAAPRQPSADAFVLRSSAGDSLELRFDPGEAGRLAYDILAAVHVPKPRGRVSLRGRWLRRRD